ncbi:ABC transporter permease [Cytophagales bacterium WSM2-2]|nr:ABC transporter permease [Cytophagales bacterium WSM2-2]
MKIQPPRWANQFLEWYCRPDLLEEIQGDVFELFSRRSKKNKQLADWLFVWDVIRFFRLKNIGRKKNSNSIIPLAMFRNIFLVSIRNAVRNPGNTFIHVAGLSIGFTCAFLILLWVMNEFSFDRFHRDSPQIYKVLSHVTADGGGQTFDVASVRLDISSIPEAETFVPVSSGQRWPHELCFRPESRQSECVYFNGIYSNENFFKVFEFPVITGNQSPFKEPASIAISEKMAASLFGTENPIGKSFKLDGWISVTISSVFRNPPANSTLRFDFVLPLTTAQKLWGNSDAEFGTKFFQAFIKTHPGVTASKLTEKLNNLSTKTLQDDHVLYEAFPMTDWRLHGKFEDGKNTGGRIEYVRLFVIIAVLIVLMAVINFINLTTARASLRSKEIAVRKVNGAFRWGIISQFIGESFLSVLTAFVVAILLTQLALHSLDSLFPDLTMNLLSGMIPWYMLGFLVVVSLAAGAYPAFVLSSFQPVKIFKSQFAGSTGSNRLRKSLLVIQLSISIGIIIFTAVIYRQLNYIINKDLGFERHNVIRVEPTYQLQKKIEPFRNELMKHSEITGMTAAHSNPLNTGGANTGVNWPGKPDNSRIAFNTLGCTYEFPEFFNLKIIEGRGFNFKKPLDSINTEVLVTRDAVKTMGLTHPIGEHISIGNSSCVIVGVINDLHTQSLHAPRLPVIIYRTIIFQTQAVYVKYQPGKTREALAIVNEAYNKFDSSFSMRYWFQEDTFNEMYKTESTASRLVLLLSFVSLVIAVIGIVGLATFNTMRKTKEIGIRRVLGATAAQVLTLLTKEFSWVMIIALIVAAPLTWYASNQWLNGYAYRESLPVWLFVLTFVGVAGLTVAIICVQSLKTILSNPTDSLRNE